MLAVINLIVSAVTLGLLLIILLLDIRLIKSSVIDEVDGLHEVEPTEFDTRIRLLKKELDEEPALTKGLTPAVILDERIKNLPHDTRPKKVEYEIAD